MKAKIGLRLVQKMSCLKEGTCGILFFPRSLLPLPVTVCEILTRQVKYRQERNGCKQNGHDCYRVSSVLNRFFVQFSQLFGNPWDTAVGFLFLSKLRLYLVFDIAYCSFQRSRQPMYLPCLAPNSTKASLISKADSLNLPNPLPFLSGYSLQSP